MVLKIGAVPAAAPGVTFVGVKVYRTGTPVLTQGSGTVMPWEAEEWDTHAFHDPSTNNSRLIVPAGQEGKYEYHLGIYSNQAGFDVTRFFAQVRKNGTQVRGGASDHDFLSSEFASANISGEVELATAGDYLDVNYFLQCAANRNIDIAATAFSMRKVS